MRDKGLDKGLIHYFDDSKRTNRGQGKGFFGFRKMFTDYLTKLNVAFYDACCAELTGTVFPLRNNNGALETFNGTEWVAFTDASAGGMTTGFYPSAVQNDIAAGTGGAISVTNYLTTINTDAGGDAFTLANGTQTGQTKKILLVVDGGGNAVVTPATAFAGGTAATFNDAGDYLILQWSGTAWVVLENSGTTIA